MDLVSGCLKTCLGMIFKRNGSLPKELAHEYEEEEFINPSAQLGFQVEEKAQF